MGLFNMEHIMDYHKAGLNPEQNWTCSGGFNGETQRSEHFCFA